MKCIRTVHLKSGIDNSHLGFCYLDCLSERPTAQEAQEGKRGSFYVYKSCH